MYKFLDIYHRIIILNKTWEMIKINKFDQFHKYLSKTHSPETAYKYSRAINTISNELINNNLLDCNIYLLNNNETISNLLSIYLSVKDLKEKNKRGNQMYSSAIKRYIEFSNQIINPHKVRNNHNTSTTTDIPKKRHRKNEKTLIKIFNRDSHISGTTIENANYLCEVNNTHKFFTSKTTQNNYVEAHHLIPLKYQDNFEFSLDVESNIVALCPVCHRLLHHSIFDEKKDILEKLYNERKNRLKSCNILIELEELLKLYK